MEVEESSKVTTTLLDLPLVDLMSTIAKYFTPKDLFALRRCSRYFKQLVDDVGIPALGLVDLSRPFRVCRTSKAQDDAEVASKKNIMKRCRNARLLKLNELWLTDELLSDFLRNNPSLEALDLNYCHNISIQALQPLLNCKNLVVLKITKMECCDDEFLRNLSQHNNQLLEIDFTYNEAFSFEVIKEFISKQPHLKCINLPDYDSQDKTESLIETIIEVCLNLESIQFYTHQWSFNTNRILVRLAAHCKKLKAIKLGDDNWEPRDFWYGNREVVIFLAARGIEFYWGSDHYVLSDMEDYILNRSYGNEDNDTTDDEEAEDD